MGGVNSQIPQGNEQATYDQLKKQGMSGSADESLGNYMAGAKSLVKDVIGKPADVPVAQNEEQAIEQLNKQEMSGMADESLAHYARMIKSLVSETANPNYKRDVTSLSKSTEPVQKEKSKPLSSYDAIDAGLR